MTTLTNAFDPETLTREIREISGRGHAVGMSTPFTHGALVLYEAGGHMNAKTEQHLIACDFVKASGGLTQDGEKLLDLLTRRGSRAPLWADEMAAAARKAPRLVAA